MKHAQCFDMALMKDGSIVLASKDYRLYIYRYVKVNYSVKCSPQTQSCKPAYLFEQVIKLKPLL